MSTVNIIFYIIILYYPAGFHSTPEYEKYMRYIDGPRKRQFGVKSGVFRSGLRSASPVGKPGLGPASKTEVDPSQATADVANTETAPQPDEGTPNERQVADTKQDVRKSPKTSRKSASTLGARRSQTRRPKSSIHQKAVGLGKDSGTPRRKQSAPLSRPKTGRGRKESSTTREQDDDAVESGRKAPSLQFLAVAMDGGYDETSGDSKEQSQDSRRSGDVQKNGYKIIPIATRRESGTQTIAAEETGPIEPETSTKACQSGEETTKDIVVVAEDDTVSESGDGETGEEDDAVKQDNRRSLTYDKRAVEGHLEITSLANNESAKKIENPDEDNALAQYNGKALIEERATKHEIHGAENAEYEGSTTGRDYDRNDNTSDTLVRRKEDDTAQATTNDRTGITEDDDVATKKSESQPTETASPSEEDELTNRQGPKEDDRITSKDSMALKKDEDGPRTEQSRNSLEEQYAVTTSGNVQSTTEEKTSVESQLDKTSREVNDKTDPETSSNDGGYTSSSGSGDDETTYDDDDAGSTTENKPAIHHPEMTSLTNERTGKKEHPHEHDVARLDNGESVADDEPPVEVHPEIAPLTYNERGENKDISSNEGNSRTIGNETKETGKEEEGAVKQVSGTDVTDQIAAARQPVGTPMTSKNESETKAQADTDSDSLSSGSGDDSTSDSGSYSTTDSGRSAASSRQSDSKIQSTDASLPVDVKAEDQRPREERESGSIESVHEVTPNGLTADDLARLQTAEDELSLGTPSSTENQSNESSDSSSFTGRYTFTFLLK